MDTLPFVKGNFIRQNKGRVHAYIRPQIEHLSSGHDGIRALSPNRDSGFYKPSQRTGFERAGLTYFAIKKFYPSQLIKKLLTFI